VTPTVVIVAFNARQSCEQTEGQKAAMLVIQKQEKNYPTLSD
jgi:hypothetical protein